MSQYYQPGRWTPHCTIASGLGPHEMMPCMEWTAGLELPLTVRAISVGLVQYPSCDALAEYRLGATAV